MSSRALRRHHRQRLWKKRGRYYWWWTEELGRKRMVIDTPKMCGRYCCSRKKQRANGEISRQERLALSNADEQLDSYWKGAHSEIPSSDAGVKVSGDKSS